MTAKSARPGGGELGEGAGKEAVHRQALRGVATKRHTVPKESGATSSTESPASDIVAANTSGDGKAAMDRWR